MNSECLLCGWQGFSSDNHDCVSTIRYKIDHLTARFKNVMNSVDDRLRALEKKSHDHSQVMYEKIKLPLSGNHMNTAVTVEDIFNAGNATQENPSRQTLEKKLSEKNIKIIALENKVKELSDCWIAKNNVIRELENQRDANLKVIEMQTKRIAELEKNLHHEWCYQKRLEQNGIINELRERNAAGSKQVGKLTHQRDMLKDKVLILEKSNVNFISDIRELESVNLKLADKVNEQHQEIAKMLKRSCTPLYGASNCK